MDPNTAESKHLMSFIERVENLNEDIKGLTEDRKEVFSEAKGVGYDVPILRQIIKIRAMDKDERDKNEALLETYMAALGMQ